MECKSITIFGRMIGAVRSGDGTELKACMKLTENDQKVADEFRREYKFADEGDKELIAQGIVDLCL